MLMGLGENVGKLMKAKRLSNGEVARGAGIADAQTVFALVKRKSKKSDHAPQLAAYFKVPLSRLLANDFKVSEAEPTASKAPSEQTELSPAARDIALAWLKLPPGRQQAIREWIFLETIVVKHYPWLMPGRPVGQSYDDYERAIESDIVRITKRMMMTEEKDK